MFMRILACFLLAAISLLASPNATHAQVESRVVPRANYTLAFLPYFEGEYETALRQFREANRTGIRSTAGRWVDSICYHTMMGECFYQAGDLTTALENYNAALQLYLTHKEWLLRVKFPDKIGPSSVAAKTRITWGSTTRATSFGHFPDVMSSLQGRFDNDQVLENGGVIVQPKLFPLRVVEILRCTTLAMSRRREIMGSLTEYDPFTRELLTALAARPGPPNHWSSSWISLQLGVAYASAGRPVEASTELTRAIQVGDRFDHPLTPRALLELGRIAYEQEKYEVAISLLMEATYSAAIFGRHDVMSEAFQLATNAHMIINKRAVFAPLAPAIAWAKTNGSAALQASLWLSLAENAADLGNTSAAGDALTQAQRIISRSEMAGGRIGARFQYASALVSYQKGNSNAGDAAFVAAMSNQRDSSKWLFQIQLADVLARDASTPMRVKWKLLTELLRDPRSKDWAVDPVESYAVLLTPPLGALENFLELALLRKELEVAIEITERIRRRRFYTALPLGGRLLSLRWILAAPTATLSESAQLQRTDLLARYPTYAKLAQQSAHLQRQLHTIPLELPEEADTKKQAGLLKQLAAVSDLQEGMLRDIALRREAAEFSFPRIRTVEEFRASMPENSAALSFFRTSRAIYAFWITPEDIFVWQAAPTAVIGNQLAAMFKSWGQHDRTQTISLDDLRNEEWQMHAAQLLTLLLGDKPPIKWDELSHLIVVPDGVLWYVPFETLLVRSSEPAPKLALEKEKDKVKKKGDEKEVVRYTPLHELLTLRTAPTLSLAMPAEIRMPGKPRIGAAVGQLNPRENDASQTANLTSLQVGSPEAKRLPQQLPGPASVYVSQVDRLVVLAEIKDVVAGPLAWSPFQQESGKRGSRISDMISLPWEGPGEVILPGYQTVAAGGLKDAGPAVGDEIFITVCGLMASGARTILISRWPVGGDSTRVLMKEFNQELPHSGAAAAWQRAIQVSERTEISIEREPKLRPAVVAAPMFADHPFFWSGYLLIDTGAPPAGVAIK